MISPSPRRSFFLPRALVLVLCVSALFMLCAVILPRISHGKRQEIPVPNASSIDKAERATTASVPGEILVRFRKSAAVLSPTVARTPLTLRQTSGPAITMQLEQIADDDELVTGLRLARVQPDETGAALAALQERADVLYAEPNYLRQPLRTPNDPRFTANDLWGLKNSTYPNWDIGAEAAWDTTTGDRSIVVGVVDTGIDISHQDLAANVWHNPGEIAANGIDDDGNGYVDDVTGWDFLHNDNTVYDGPGTNPDGSPVDAHGTHVAGTIGATGDNGVGVVGVNWQVSILPLKFIGPQGGRSSDLLRALAYAKSLRERGVNLRVLNNSYGGGGYSQAERDAIRALADAGILFVVAAGNESSDNDHYPRYPASYNAPNLISVAATTRYSGVTTFTNYGARTVHLYAPGEGVLSTTPGNTYSSYSGTSMAAPHVAGTAALVCAARPDISMARLRAAVLYSGTNFSPYAQPTITNRFLNAAAALQNAAVVDTVAPAAVGNLRFDPSYQTTDLRQRRLLWTAPGGDDNSGRAAVYEIRFSDTDISSPAQFAEARLLPAPPPQSAGTAEAQIISIPFRHQNGFIGVRAVDSAGNAGPITTLAVTVDQAAADPYVVTVSQPSPLYGGGTPLNLHADDGYTSYRLPFYFTYFGAQTNTVTVSSNGALYFGLVPSLDRPATAEWLAGTRRIAGLWDDLRTDRRPGDDVYVVQPDLTRVIFRWQAVTYDLPLADGTTRGENPVNFEIELRRDGTIITRYGDGNRNLLPVVGLSGGDPDAYPVPSHTSEAALKDLTFAQTVTYAPRVPTPLPTVDMALDLVAAPIDVVAGQQVAVVLTLNNNSTVQDAEQTIANVQLPAGLRFIDCRASQGICATDWIEYSGNLSLRLYTFPRQSRQTYTITLQAVAPPNSSLPISATVTNFWADSNPGNNAATALLDVVVGGNFGGVRAVSAGGESSGLGGYPTSGHTLALKTDGTVWSWGTNSSGQLGVSASANVNTPVQVGGLTDVIAVSAGGAHSLALKADGTVWAWGSNSSGQLGAGEPSSVRRNVPVMVSGLSGVTAISAGGGHSLALKADGTVWAWGSDTSGQLGNVPSISSSVPVQARTDRAMVSIAAGSGHSLAVASDGTVWAWGANSSGQCGQSTIDSRVFAPSRLYSLTNFAQVSAGGNFSAALRQDGTVWAWGDNGYGQLGYYQGGSSSAYPYQATGVTDVAAIEAGSEYMLALKADGTFWGWGRNTYGMIGKGAPNNFGGPIQVNLGGVPISFTAGPAHSVVVLQDGTVLTWGSNDAGQLGTQTYAGRFIPAAVPFGAAVPPPVFTPAGGTYVGAQDITINSINGATVRYTTDGSEPTDSAPVLAAGATLRVEQTLVVKARASKDGLLSSQTASAAFTINPIPVVSLRFGAPSYEAREDSGRALITIIRDGDLSTTASVDYATIDDPADVGCADTVNNHAAAYARCDYATTIDTLTFLPGETQKSITVPVIDDAHVEGAETVQLRLSSPQGGTLGQQTATTLTITDNDAGGTPNPVYLTPFFVRQQYLDFLSREPEQSGFDAWTGVLNRCADPGNVDPNNPSAGCDRITVSASFFGSTEFQLKGSYVFRFYRVAFGRLPTYNEIVVDMRAVTGQTAAEVFQKKAAFANAFTQRAEFTNLFPATMSNSTFVSTLFGRYSLTQVTTPDPAAPDGATKVTLTSTVLVNRLNTGALTRAQVLRAIADSDQVGGAEFNRAFVFMQYAGYLRRTPEQSGFNAWLNYLNGHPGDFRTMVNGFMNSTEYRLRFGSASQ